MKKIILLIAGIVLAVLAHAQPLTQTVRGKIVDSQSESPLIGATVVVTGTNPLKGAVTNVDGEFSIAEVPVGRHDFKITYIVYEDAFLAGQLVGTGSHSLFVDLNVLRWVLERSKRTYSSSPYSRTCVLFAKLDQEGGYGAYIFA